MVVLLMIQDVDARTQQKHLGEVQEELTHLREASEREHEQKVNLEAKVQDLQTYILNVSQRSETLAEHLDEFETQNTKWSAEKKMLLIEQQKLKDDLGGSLRLQKASYDKMSAENETLKASQEKLLASFDLLKKSEREERNKQSLSLMAENEALVQQKLDSLHGVRRLEGLLLQSQHDRDMKTNELVALRAELREAKVDAGVLQVVLVIIFYS
jgi:hypothetical protein